MLLKLADLLHLISGIYQTCLTYLSHCYSILWDKLWEWSPISCTNVHVIFNFSQFCRNYAVLCNCWISGLLCYRFIMYWVDTCIAFHLLTVMQPLYRMIDIFSNTWFFLSDIFILLQCNINMCSSDCCLIHISALCNVSLLKCLYNIHSRF